MERSWLFLLALLLGGSLAACFGDEDLGSSDSGAAGSAGRRVEELGDAGATGDAVPAVCRAFCGTRSPACDVKEACEASCASLYQAHPECASLSDAYFYCRALLGCGDAATCDRQRQQSEECYSPMMTP